MSSTHPASNASETSLLKHNRRLRLKHSLPLNVAKELGVGTSEVPLVCQCGPLAKLWWGLMGTIKSPEAKAFLATWSMLHVPWAILL